MTGKTSSRTPAESIVFVCCDGPRYQPRRLAASSAAHRDSIASLIPLQAEWIAERCVPQDLQSPITAGARHRMATSNSSNVKETRRRPRSNGALDDQVRSPSAAEQEWGRSVKSIGPSAKSKNPGHTRSSYVALLPGRGPKRSA